MKEKKNKTHEFPEIDFGDMTEKQKAVYLAAVDLIAEKGYEATSTSEIAERAGVAEGTIFKHFKSKKELFKQITNPFIKKFFLPLALKAVNNVLLKDYSNFQEFLSFLFQDRILFASKHRKFLKILVQEAWINDELREYFILEFQQKVWPNLKAVIVKFQTKGEIKNLPPEIIFSSIISHGGSYLFRRFILLPDLNYDDKKDVSLLVSLVLNGIGN